MKAAWYKTNASLFAKIRQEIEGNYPDLQLTIENGIVLARGNFPVKNGADILDRFQIQVEFPHDYPNSVVVLRETGGRIPWHPDRHANRTGESCPIVPEEWLVRSDRDSLLAFLEGPVRNFFLGQILVEQGKPWPFGEREHGVPGLLQSYGELVGSTDAPTIYRYLESIAKQKIKGHWECPCGSKVKLRNCHLETVKRLRERISPSVARSALKRLRSY